MTAIHTIHEKHGVIRNALLAGTPFLLAGLWFAIDDVIKLTQGLSAQSWKEVEAVVIEATLEEYRDFEDRLFFKPVIQYEYQWEGRTYRSDRFDIGEDALKGSDAKKFLESHPVGSRHSVYVDPDNPESALFDKTGAGNHFEGIIFAVVLLVLPGGALVYVGIRWEPSGPNGEIL